MAISHWQGPKGSPLGASNTPPYKFSQMATTSSTDEPASTEVVSTINAIARMVATEINFQRFILFLSFLCADKNGRVAISESGKLPVQTFTQQKRAASKFTFCIDSWQCDFMSGLIVDKIDNSYPEFNNTILFSHHLFKHLKDEFMSKIVL
jgi:hypothetical protein